MTDDFRPFEFSDDLAGLADSPADAAGSQLAAPLVVKLPGGLRGKRKLLAEYVRQLSLPEYFGWNWDALDECLRDLSWLERHRSVILVHGGLPFHGHRQTRKTYLELLRDAVRFWASGPQPQRLRVVFPRRAEATIQHLIPIE